MQEMSLPLTIRPASLNDVPAIVGLHICSWQWAYRGQLPDEYLTRLPELFDRRVEARQAELAQLPPDHRRWVAERTGKVVGFVITQLSRGADASPETGEIRAVYLEPEAVGQGIGRLLFAQAVADLQQRGFTQATLWVLESNGRACRFYEAAGWSPDGASKTEERPGALLREGRYRCVL